MIVVAMVSTLADLNLFREVVHLCNEVVQEKTKWCKTKQNKALFLNSVG
jgi:hypothetical protein